MSFFKPYLDHERLDALARCCDTYHISPADLLDVGLCMLGIDRLTAYHSLTRDALYLDIQELQEAAAAAKQLGYFLRGLEPDLRLRLAALLLILKASVVNMQGYCGMSCHLDGETEQAGS
ncbi:hypothetical protein [Desulfofundulus thermocisternus]|uniref:hypothetical protein n=1 Tax=Desulfofundulus thermocisternus TaxID=42471 RepID=UPI0004811B3D|nr:hypothetical protein [Desulfofundulus thermocisternus]